MLRHGHANEAVLKELNQLKDLVNIAKEVIIKQQTLHLTTHLYRVRKYSTYVSKTFVAMPSHINGEEDLLSLFDPLLEYVGNINHLSNLTPANASTSTSPSCGTSSSIDLSSPTAIKEAISQVGAVVSVRWSTNAVRGSGWKAGWYRAEVQGYCDETDVITLCYVSQPNESYEEDLSLLVQQNKIKLLRSTF